MGNVVKNILTGKVFSLLRGNDSAASDEKVTTEVGATEVVANLDIGVSWEFVTTQFVVTPGLGDYAKKIFTWRRCSELPEVEDAIDEIVNEACVTRTNEAPIKLEWIGNEISDSVKKIIEEEWEYICSLVGVQTVLDDIFRQGYIDGVLFFENVYEKGKPDSGVVKLNLLPPHQVAMFYADGKRKYLYSPNMDASMRKRFVSGKTIRDDNAYIFDDTTMTFVMMGRWNADKTIPISYIDKAVKIANQLSALEDALVVYRIVRAPERRAFYVDVGKMPKTQAEEYIRNLADKYRSAKFYNTATGEVHVDKAVISSIEDFWLPRRNGKGTEVQTLDGGQSLGEIDDVLYFLRKLYKSLKVPRNRIDTEATFPGGISELTRDEIRFYKFVKKLQKKFNVLFYDLLRKNLILKKKIKPADWDTLKDQIVFVWNSDNNFSEMKELDVLGERLRLLSDVEEHVGTYFSRRFVQKKVLRLTDSEIENLEKEMEEERKNAPQEDTSEF